VLAQGNLDFHARAGVAAQNFRHAAYRFAMRAGLGNDFHCHDLAWQRCSRVAGRDENVLVDTAIFRDQKADALFQVVATHHELVDVLQHLDDLRFAPSAPVEAGHPHQHFVAVQHAVHFLGRQEQVVASFIGRDKAEPVRMAFDAPLDEVQLVRQAKQALAVQHQLAVALHRTEATLEQFALVVRDVQLLGQRIRLDRTTRLGQQLQDVFATGQGRFIAFDFTFIERIGQTDRRNFVLCCTAT